MNLAMSLARALTPSLADLDKENELAAIGAVIILMSVAAPRFGIYSFIIRKPPKESNRSFTYYLTVQRDA